ncbi:MAG: M13 family metallopeptidase [Oscillospiraceae bacterium]|nr:M13 family metallopeptidase [Oscillospiraceae bacterium]
MKKLVLMFLAAVLMLSLAGCQRGEQDAAQGAQVSEPSETGSSGVAESAEKKMTPWINTNVVGTVTADNQADLKDDYNLAVNYDYLKDTTLREGRVCEDGFQEVQDIIDKRLLRIVTDDTIEGHDAKLLRELYAMWLDWDARNAAGISELMPHIEIIQQIETLEDLTKYLSSEEGVLYGASLSGTGLTADMEDARWYCLDIGGTPLSLDDSDEYENLTSVGERSLKAYREEAGLLLGKAGYDKEEAEAIIDNAYAFEEALAPSMLSTAETYSPDVMEKILNKVTMEELAEMSPNYPLTAIINTMGLENSEKINLEQPEWLSKLNELYTEENLEQLKSYVLVQTLLTYGTFLDEETYRAIQEISHEAFGITGSRPDEELALNTVELFLQTSLSKVYAREYVTEEMRDDVTQIINESIEAYRTMLTSEEWLSDETREKALEKLDHITLNVAYPDKWEDTEKLQITAREDGGSFYNAIFEIDNYLREQEKAKVNTEIDRESWADDMSLTDANAFYDSSTNAIYIIAGILEGNFYSPDMTEEEKLAGIGTVIGHELSHAFDTNGAQFDKDGNFANWWTDEDYAAFHEHAQKLVNYYNTVVPFDGGENYPGNNVQGEAIADMAGVKCMLLLAKEKENFDYDAFFRAYSKLWKCVCSREYCELIIYQDTHPMDYLRINITLMQLPEFYETYDIKEGDGMYMAEEDRISVW